jgi:hypothetical protein
VVNPEATAVRPTAVLELCVAGTPRRPDGLTPPVATRHPISIEIAGAAATNVKIDVLAVLACAVAGQLPEGVVCTMRGVDLGDRPTPQLPHRVVQVVSQDGEGSTHTRFTAGSQAVGVGATDLDRLGP